MRRLIASLALVAGMVLPASLSDVAASPSVAPADPSIGPNAISDRVTAWTICSGSPYAGQTKSAAYPLVCADVFEPFTAVFSASQR